MLGSTPNRNVRAEGNVYGRTNMSGQNLGKQATCELCETQSRCVDNHGLLACQTCRQELLPSPGLI